jgi:holin-like protein
MLLFLVVLRVRKPADDSGLVMAPTLLLQHLHLLFIPAGVGIMVYLSTIVHHAWPLALGLWGSWILGFVATALISSGLLRLAKERL